MFQSNIVREFSDYCLIKCGSVESIIKLLDFPNLYLVYYTSSKYLYRRSSCHQRKCEKAVMGVLGKPIFFG